MKNKTERGDKRMQEEKYSQSLTSSDPEMIK